MPSVNQPPDDNKMVTYETQLANFYANMRGFQQMLSYGIRTEDEYEEAMQQLEVIRHDVYRRVSAVEALTRRAITQRDEAIGQLNELKDQIHDWWLNGQEQNPLIKKLVQEIEEHVAETLYQDSLSAEVKAESILRYELSCRLEGYIGEEGASLVFDLLAGKRRDREALDALQELVGALDTELYTDGEE